VDIIKRVRFRLWCI